MIAASPTQAFIGAMFAAIDSSRFDALPRFFHHQVIYDRPGFAPIHGIADLQHFYAHVRLIRSGRHLVEQLVTDGASAVALGTFCGELQDGSAAREPFADTYEFRDGLVVKRRTFFFRPAI